MGDEDPFGLLVVDKPAGPTSHDVVQWVRRGTGVKKVGHTGTLDPRASGILLLCLGRATRLSEYLLHEPKRYLAWIHFGRSTTTYDAEGDVVGETGRSPDKQALERTLREFQGTLEQRPPAYSAVKVKGRRAYKLSRRGEVLELKPRQVTIEKLILRSYQPPMLELEVHCSAGTYIRSLAHDLGQRLQTGAHLAELRRTRVGAFGLDQAVELSVLGEAVEAELWRRYLIPAAQALPDMPAVMVQGEKLQRVRHGRLIERAMHHDGPARALGPDGELVAVLHPAEDGESWHPRKVFLR